MHPRQWQQATTLREGQGGRSSSNSKRRPLKTPIAPPKGTTVARLSKWPENVYFASDFIAEKAAPMSARRRSLRHGPRTKASCGPLVARGENQTIPVAPRRSSGGNGTTTVVHGLHRRTEQTSDHGPEGRKHFASGGEAGSFLEESASALLRLHSRFFGGIRQEEDIVCRLCALCREAGWIGNLDLGGCPDLDPLVLEEMAVARLREGIQHSDEEFAFETFYRILADVARLVYPREGRAMHRLLVEGVLPLAADTEPRQWSPRPELLYGRPALAALRMQRDTLHQLYCTYDTRARSREGTSGIGRSLFVEMLLDLGVSPASVSEQRASWVFDDVVRNGLRDPRVCIRPTQQALRRNSNGHETRDGEVLVGIGNGKRGGRHSRSRKHPRGDRLCWSLFLEAMAALAVGAVRRQAPTTIRNDRGAFPQPKPDSHNWVRSSQDNCCEFRGLGDGGVCEKESTPFSWREDDGGVPERLGSCRTSHESGHSPTEIGEPGQRRTSGRMAGYLSRNDEPGGRLLPPRGEHVAGSGAPGRDRQTAYGRGFCHDSRRSLELMPTLKESDAPPAQKGSSPVGSRQPRAQERRGDGTKLEPEPTPSPAVSIPLGEGEPAAARHAVGSVPEVPRNFEFSNTVNFEGRQTARNQASAAWTTRPKMVISDGMVMTEAEGEAANPFYERHLGGLLTRPHHGRLAARKAAATLESPAAAVARPPLSMKGMEDFDGKEVVGVSSLSPAPFHGGSPSALSSSVLPITSEGSGGSTHSASADTDIPPADKELLPAFETRAAKHGAFLRPPSAHSGSGDGPGCTGLAADISFGGERYSHHCVEKLTAASMVGSGASHGRASERGSGNTSSHRRHKERPRPGWSDVEQSYCRDGQKSDGGSKLQGCSASDTRSEVESGLATDKSVVMNLEAVGCTATLFEELLEPRVVAVYSRHRKGLRRLFQRYSSETDGETSRYIRDDDADAGIWRFVSDFPVLRRWGEGESILRLIVRASRDRGWGRQGGAEEPVGHSSGLSYFGFLEVLTRMAFATDGRSPLHRKLEAFICALELDDPRGILAS